MSGRENKLRQEAGVTKHSIDARSAPPERRKSAAWEIVFVVACVLVAEWAILPLFGRNLLIGMIPVALAFAFMFISHYRHHETAGELGWRMDNLLQALGLLLPPMLAASALLIVTGWFVGGLSTGRLRTGWPLLWRFMSLFVWGAMQQYALQAFINRRAQIIWGRGGRSILVVAAIFGLLHLPNLPLTLATLAAGLLWAAVYQRTPNLIALALSHSLMTVVLLWTVPAALLHGLRVGFNYYR